MEAELTFVRSAGAGGAAADAAAAAAVRAAAHFSRASAASRRRPKRPASASTTRSSSCPTRNYKPRALRSALGLRRASAYENYSAPLGEPMTQRFIRRHRLAEEGSVGGGQRAGQADRLLPRSRRARADPLGAARRRALVEPGVRGGRLSQRVPRRAAARRRQPARHPLQRHQLGASIDARLEHRRQRRPIRAPARSSRASSRSARCASGRTT